MYLNKDGLALMGQEQTTVSVQRAPMLRDAGIGGWLTDRYFVANALLPASPGRPAGWYVVQYDSLLDRLVTTLQDGGANTLVAGGGRWLGWSPDGMFGTPVAPPDEMRKADVRGAGLDGTLAWCRNRNTGVGLVLTAPDGTVVEIASAVAFDVHVLGPGKAVWFDGQSVHSVGLAVKPALPSGKMRVATVEGVDWLVYWSEGTGLIAQPNGDDAGYILETRPIAFNHDAVCTDNGDLVVAWSTTQGEGPDDLAWQIVDRAAPRVPLVKPVPPVTFKPFNHKVLIAAFKDPEGEGGSAAEVVVNQTGQHTNRPFFVAEDSLDGSFKGELIGLYSEAHDPSALIAGVARDTRLLLCHDDVTDWAPPAAMRPWDVPAIELYFPRMPGTETLVQSVARWQRQAADLARRWPGDLGLVLQFYCMGGAPPNEAYPLSHVLNGLNFASDIVNSNARFKVVCAFAWQRANGIVAHPELRQAFESLLRATPGVPVLLPVDPTPPDPPKPTPEHYKKLKPYRLGGTMSTERGYLVGAGKKYVKGDAAKPGIFPDTFFAGAVNDGKEDSGEFEARERPDGRFNLFHVESGMPLEMDATAFSRALDKQYYLKPGDGESAYSILEGRVEDPGGSVLFYKKFDNEQPVNVAASLVWVKK